MTHSNSESRPPVEDGAVAVTVAETGAHQYSITATAALDAPIDAIWPLFDDFEKLVATALPGVASEFEWLNGGGPGRVPSTFQFVASGTRIVEEVYELDRARGTLRYRVLEPALGILVYDSALELAPISDRQTRYTSRREATLEPGAIDGLAGLIELETQNLKNHFAKQP